MGLSLVYIQTIRDMGTFIQNRKTEPKRKMRFGSDLKPINYISGSYFSRTVKPEPNTYPDFYNIVYIFINTNKFNFKIIK